MQLPLLADERDEMKYYLSIILLQISLALQRKTDCYSPAPKTVRSLGRLTERTSP